MMGQITAMETGYGEFLTKFPEQALQLAMMYDENVDTPETENVAIKVVLYENTMLYGEIGYAGQEWKMPSPEDREKMTEFLEQNTERQRAMRDGLNVLSLFDGISCGMLALERADLPVNQYDAFEIDKYAIQVSEKNFPEIVHHGDVFDGDFTQFQGYDLLIGGSPCTFWSIAKNNREITPDGFGGKLFMQYVRAWEESKCRYFLYENNYSIHKNIKNFISKKLDVKPIMINSALVSAQQRRRCYWTNISNLMITDSGHLRFSVRMMREKCSIG